MSLQTIEYRGWKDCLLLDNGDIELVVSVGLGPRVLSFKRKDGANFFKNFDDQMANISQDTWQSYGGHRLWHAPEVWTRTYYPDVQPVKYEWDGSRLTLTCETETVSRLQKEIVIDFTTDGKMQRKEVSDAQYDADGYIQSFKLNVMGQELSIAVKWEDGHVKTQTMNVMGQEMVITRSYNEQGAPAEDSINLGGMENKSPYSEYQYDDHGNWISRKGSIMGQEMTQTRTIEYYE